MANSSQDLIDTLVAAVLKGKIQSKQQIYRQLKEGVELGSGELFERCLDQTLAQVAQALDSEDDLKQAKAIRQQRALAMIQSEWQRWQADNQATTVFTSLETNLIQAPPEERLTQLLQALDPNRDQPLSRQQIGQLTQALKQAPPHRTATDDSPPLATLAAGLDQGLVTWQRLEGEVVSWIYAQGQRSLGFGAPQEQAGPWYHWGKLVPGSPLATLFEGLAQQQQVSQAAIPDTLPVAEWVSWAVVLQRLQLALVSWFDRQPYDPKAGKRLSIATFLTFAVVWSQISSRLQTLGQGQLAQGAFQMTIQVLRQFATQSYFPLYGGLFTALSGEPLRTLLDYLDQPLQQVPNTAVKARILTLLGYSQRALGDYSQAERFHQQALTIAREAQDHPCEVANLNHLSRTNVMQDRYDQAIDYSQRALILARQQGDTTGQANALANLGYSQVAQGRSQLLPIEQYETLLGYLTQGVALSERVGDLPSQALCTNSLGIAQLKLSRYDQAVEALTKGLGVAQAIGDRFLMASNFAQLAAAYQGQGNLEQAVLTGCLGMYLLYQIDSPDWRQPAAVLSILYGQLGPENVQLLMANHRQQFLAVIGVDGYDYLLPLLTRYRESLGSE
ncbi:tetratricopeptide repeat protein [Nodosilinea sp. P-1105]|uniref:tetratricopeptide repeat protein n=1 Tax=Nodosilinea sp. P-1105 TaxID=2546229 RepID=UPI00146D7418|nr:tetratricopeptide repeat protein [Nodosilinea sp. P-1105]NMF82710.1 tetratricopeptide repeat protein [Nodosilinea sp. P-1105]